MDRLAACQGHSQCSSCTPCAGQADSKRLKSYPWLPLGCVAGGPDLIPEQSMACSTHSSCCLAAVYAPWQLWLFDATQHLSRQREAELNTIGGGAWTSLAWALSGGRQAVLQRCLQDEAVRGQQHVEGLQLRVSEQKQLLAQYRKEGRRMKKTLATYEVGPAARNQCTGVALLYWPGQCYIILPPCL